MAAALLSKARRLIDTIVSEKIFDVAPIWPPRLQPMDLLSR
jgi:hypothetical protein